LIPGDGPKDKTQEVKKKHVETIASHPNQDFPKNIGPERCSVTKVFFGKRNLGNTACNI
jgi:hypothetical protein